MDIFTREGFAAAFLLQTMPMLLENSADDDLVAETVKLSVNLANALCDELHRNRPETDLLGELMQEPQP